MNERIDTDNRSPDAFDLAEFGNNQFDAIREQIVGQLPQAMRAFAVVSENLSQMRTTPESIIETVDQTQLIAELTSWLSQDKLAYVARVQEVTPGTRFTLVATPNLVADFEEIAELATAFGVDQPYETYINASMRTLYNNYSPEQLSGTNPNNGEATMFSLIPNRWAAELNGTVEEQRTILRQLQVEYPFLKVPSVLEAITYWYTLREHGDKLSDNTAFDKNYIRHFDLPSHRAEGDWYVPNSGVNDSGRPGLHGSLAIYSTFCVRSSIG